MSILTIGTVVLASLYIGAVMGALIKFTTYQVPHARKWMAFVLPIGIPFQPLILFVFIKHAQKEIKQDWINRSMPQKFLLVASVYVAYFADLPLVLGIVAHALAESTAPDAISRQTDKRSHAYIREFARESSLDIVRFVSAH